MLNKFKKVAELVLIPKTAREFLEKELRHERQCPYCGEMFGYLTFDQRNKYNYHLKLHRLDGHQCDCDLQFK